MSKPSNGTWLDSILPAVTGLLNPMSTMGSGGSGGGGFF